MADILDQSAKKRRLKNEDDSERESNDKRRRYSTSKGSSRSIYHSNRHKYKRKDDEERRRSRHRHRRENPDNSSSHSSQSRGIIRKHRRSYSRDKDSSDKFNTLNGRWKGSFYERSPPRGYPHLSRRRWYVSPLAGYREKSRSPRQNRYERDGEYDEPYERDDYSAAMRRNSRGYPELKREIQDFLRIEHHHLAFEGKEDSNGDIQDVEWCYTYLDPAISGHIKGGKAKLHHRCRQCNRICLHLLGVCFTRERMCLVCAAKERGWREDEVPSWYFHKASSCRHCSTRQRYYGNY